MLREIKIGVVIGLVLGLSLLGWVLIADAQTQYPALPVGMRVYVGGGGALARNTPSLNGTCGTPAHTCTTADSVPPNTYGVIQPDPFVLDAAGWYWEKVNFDNGQAGWVSAYPPYLNATSPPQMIQGVAITIVGDYNGPVLTQGTCILDGLNSAAVLALQPTTGGQMGTLQCPWVPVPAIGNHKAVIRAQNTGAQGQVQTADSAEFQFIVSTAPVVQTPAAPANLRIAPQGGVKTLEAPPAAATAKPKE